MARVLLGVTGGIAAYKACELTRLLVRAGHEVIPLVTRGADRFVRRETFSALARRPRNEDPYPHLERADLLLIAPLTANTLAKLAHGLADDVLTEAALAHRGPILVAPAMNPRMWEHAATQANAAILRERGVELVGPEEGETAEGEHGVGRMAEPETIFARCEELLGGGNGPLRGKRILVGAGGTREPLDAVRFVGNRSSGRMGVALAEEARRRGADVTLIASNLDVPPPPGIEVVQAPTAADVEREASARATADVVLMASAVSDYRPSELEASKRPKRARTASRARARSSSPSESTSSSTTTSPATTSASRLPTTRSSSSRPTASAVWAGRRRRRSPPRSSTRWRSSCNGGARGEASWAGRVGGGRPAGRREPREGHPCAGGDPPHVRALPRQRRASDHRGLPGSGEDDAGEGARALSRLLLLADPVHAGPASLGRDGGERLQPALERVRVPARARLRQPPPGRRDQPSAAEDAGCPARVHAGEPDHDRRRQLRARAAFHGRRDAEPDRVRGDVPTARGAARPLHDAPLDRLPAARRGSADARRADERAAAGESRAGDERDRDHRRGRRGDADLRRGQRSALRRGARPADAGRREALPGGKPARRDRASSRREGSGARRRSRVRAARRRAGGSGGRARPPAHPGARGPRGRDASGAARSRGGRADGRPSLTWRG